jgi:ABC-type sugar transport system ATPase subunit
VYDNIGFSLRIQKADKQERDKRIRTIARMLGLEGDLHR